MAHSVNMSRRAEYTNLLFLKTVPIQRSTPATQTRYAERRFKRPLLFKPIASKILRDGF